MPAETVPTSLAPWLAEPHADLRARVLALLGTPPFRFPVEIDRAAYRERVLEAVRRLAHEGLGRLGYPADYGGAGAPGQAIAVFETLAFGDLSVLVKFGVQFGLWGGSVLQLGTAKHHERWLRGIGTLEIPGCYAMTEVGHGSNVRAIRTTATWDPGLDAFVVQSPDPAASKDWIGNAALHGRLATVFARLVVGGVDRGVHALVVPLRDESGRTLPGVHIEDVGPKVGLNGVDNGRIRFDGVRVPRDHLLDRFAAVTPEGRYESPIGSEGRRFFTMLGTLVAGRISIAAASVSAAKMALTIAVRYGERRLQFGPDDGPEVALLDHRVHRRLLLTRVATTWALHFAARDLVARYARVLERRGAGDEPPEEEVREVETHAAALKAIASWHAVDVVQASREAMGGRGYDALNRLGQLRDDVDVFTTFEGVNTVLLQLVARSLLTEFHEEMGDLDFMDIVRYVADRAGTRVRERNPIATRRTERDHLRDPDWHRAAFRYREERLVESAARRLKALMDDGVEPFAAFDAAQDHLVEAARAHAERVALESFLDAVGAAPDEARPLLARVACLHALSRLERDRAWFLEAGYVEPPKSRAIRAEVNALVDELRPLAVGLVDAWGIPDAVLAAPDGIRT